MIKTVLIGITGYAGIYLKNLLNLHDQGEIELVAVVVQVLGGHEEQVELLKKRHISIFRNSSEMWQKFAAKVDWCCIPTSIHSHEQLCIEALEAKANVLVEKPAAATVSQIEQMLKTAKENNKQVFVGYQNMAEDATWLIKNAILNGDIGKVKSAHLVGLWPRTEEYYTRNVWAGKKQLNGNWVMDSVLHNAFAHFMNLACFWLGKSDMESAEIQNVDGFLGRTYNIETFDTCSVNITTKTDAFITLNLSHACNISIDPKIRVEGEKGVIEWFGNYYFINGEKFSIAENTDLAIDNARKNMFRAVLNRLKGGAAKCCTLEMAKTPTLVVNSLHESVEIETISSFYTIQTAHGNQRVIPKIEEMMLAAYENGTVLMSFNRAE